MFDAHGNLVRTMSSTLPPPIEGEAFPRYWLATPESLALSTRVGLNRVNWNLYYDDPPALRHDLENEMNMVAGAATPGPHGPQVIPGVYKLKLTVDGKDYTRDVTVSERSAGRPEPRRSWPPCALRTSSRCCQFEGMKQSFDGHDEVDAVKDQLASLMQGTLPADVAAQAKTLEASLTKIGGVVPGEGGGGGGRRGAAPDPNALKSFVELNDEYNTMVSMMQVGLDMAPTATQIDTWKSDCANSNRTAAAWKGMQQQITDFNAVLTKNHLQELKVTPTKLTDASCTFTPEVSTKVKK